MKNFVIIVSAGQGKRMGAKEKKQYLCLENIPILARTILCFELYDKIHEIILVVPKEDRAYCQKKIIDSLNLTKKIHLVAGGDRRQDSVWNGLQKIAALNRSLKDTIVLIHDGVRPFVDERIIEDCITVALKHGACIPGVKLTDTIKRAGQNGCIQKTLDREVLFSAQTPQVFKFGLIMQAFDYAGKTSFSGTDDASLVEHFGRPVFIVPGSKLNIKITTPDDLVLGQQILKQSRS